MPIPIRLVAILVAAIAIPAAPLAAIAVRKVSTPHRIGGAHSATLPTGGAEVTILPAPDAHTAEARNIDAHTPDTAGVEAIADEASSESSLDTLYRELGLAGAMDFDVFVAGIKSVEQRGMEPTILAIADMSQPSTEKRLHIMDLKAKKVLLRTWVAHGQNSGNLMAEKFSNQLGSHQTSLGLYRVGSKITSPKHGPALLLHGLDKGVNDKALPREIIIHGADYVSADFVSRNGRLGRSWGCPAVPREDMSTVISLMAETGLLYVFGN